MRGLYPRRQTLIRLAAASCQRSTFSHKGRREDSRSAGAANRDGRPAAISATAAPDYATLLRITAIKASAGRQASQRIREKAHAVQGFAEHAQRIQRRGMAGAG